MSDQSAAHVIQDAIHLIAKSLNEVVPPEAQVHFLNAQRELLLGLVVCIEHNSQRSLRDPRKTPARTRARAKAAPKRTTRPGSRSRRTAEPVNDSNRPQRVRLD